MRIRNLIVVLSGLALASLSFAQGSLTVGDNAPAFPIAGVIKGNGIEKLELGKTYVVEFWATWCGPCIESMPHLSELADRYKGKVEFFSVNTWDYTIKGTKNKEEVPVHTARVTEWVNKNSEKMRYNVVLDDAKDTIAVTWMMAAGQYGIPTAMIVNDEGKIAWIGHPMGMDKPLEAIANKTWDMAAFKKEFDAQIAAQKAAEEAEKKLAVAIKAGDRTVIDKFIASGKGGKQREIMTVLQIGINENPELAYEYLSKHAGKVEGVDPSSWCMYCRYIAPGLTKPQSKAGIVKLSESLAKKTGVEDQAVAYTYHASVLNSTGSKDAAKQWIEKARVALKSVKEGARENVSNFIENTAKSFK